MKTVSFKMTLHDPHAKRREKILEQYPDVKKLMVVESKTKYYIALNIILQILVCIYANNITDTTNFVCLAYIVGATLNHSLFLAIHELSHNTAFKSIESNQYMSIVANLPIGIPYCASFRRYHLQHHYKLGQDADTDLPTDFECWLVSYTSFCYIDHCVRKTLYLTVYTLIYALRPVIIRPDIMKLDKWFFMNVTAQIVFNLLLIHFVGSRSLFFLLLSTFLAGSLHPLSGRFLSEHLLLVDSQETYSYYGPFNYVLWQIGRHQEHHDFPNIPFTNLPALTQIAPDYYSNQVNTISWSETTMQFIFDDSMGPHRRMKRSTDKSNQQDSSQTSAKSVAAKQE